MAGTSDDAPVVANNGRTPAVRLAAGRENRIRFVNITAADMVAFELLDGDSVVAWRTVAHDGADLPPALAVAGPARMRLGAGEIADVVIVPERTLRLDVRSFNNFTAVVEVHEAGMR